MTDTIIINTIITKEFFINNPDKIYLISRLGGGLANRFGIWEAIVEPLIKNRLAIYNDRIEYLY